MVNGRRPSQPISVLSGLVQQGELTVQELFLGGKLKMEGDYSLALQIAMQLLTNPL